MNVLHVVAAVPPSGGGLSELVPYLARGAVNQGHDVTIATVARQDEPLSLPADEAATAGVRIVRFTPAAPRALFFSWQMLCGLEPLVRAADVVHVHSNWTFPVWWACHCALRAAKPIVMSPQGCLDPVRLHHSAWKKRLAGIWDRRFLRRATVIHATSDAERLWIQRYVAPETPGNKHSGRRTSPRIVVIPNGVDMPTVDPAAQKTRERVRQALYLGRLHPLKGLDLLVEAWRIAKPAGWQLVIAGPDEQGTREQAIAHAEQMGLTVGTADSAANVVFRGPLFGADKTRALAGADLLVLPSRSENFGIVVAEALAAGLPAIATTATPWQELRDGCGWWVDVDAPAIAAALTAATQVSDDQRAAMGVVGRRLVAARYSWDTVVAAMTALYETLRR
jgi:glycosyltransferase involved in cell wall biosynthesis